MEKLYGIDYLMRPYLELVGHPDFDADAFRIVALVSGMKTEQLLTINLIEGINNG